MKKVDFHSPGSFYLSRYDPTGLFFVFWYSCLASPNSS